MTKFSARPHNTTSRVVPYVLSALLALTLSTTTAIASDLVVRPSKYSVTETIDRLTAALEAKGIKPLARIDHAAAAAKVGEELRPTIVLLFGNPKIGTPLMRANPHAAIDLPMRVVAFEDASGKVSVGYVPAATLKARHGLAGVDKELNTMAGALEAFVKAASE